MSDPLAAALAIDRGVRLRAAPQAHDIPQGLVLRHSALPRVYYLNALLLGGRLLDELGAQDVIALGNRWLGDLGHRQMTIDDPRTADRVTPGLLDRGFERTRTLFMAFTGDPAAGRRDPRVREVSDSELRALQLVGYEREHRGSEASAVPVQLADAQVAARASTPARRFGAGVDDGLQSSCTLFLDAGNPRGRVAMIEEVGTLPEYRERGLAKAVVSAALRAAGDWGADLIVVPADADDWPQLLYARLGFAPIGRQLTFTRRPGADRRSAGGSL